MAGIGLVLGAGGIGGQAYHAGVLAALEAGAGWDPRSADVIVGTSAGAITATMLRGGVPALDLAAWIRRAPLSIEGKLIEDLFGSEFPELEPLLAWHFLRRPSLPGPALIRRLLLRPLQPPGAALLLTLLAPGRSDISRYLDPLREIEPRGWHNGDLWICAVRRRDGRRVIFGAPGAPAAPLHLAVAASCAVPGYFAPVLIHDVAYVDGGVHSPTNAAVLARRPLQQVVVVSPMSGGRGLPTDATALVRRHAGFRLGLELRTLRDAGLEVLLFEPDAAVQEVMGDKWMSRSGVEEITAAAFDSALAVIARDGIADALGRYDQPQPGQSAQSV